MKREGIVLFVFIGLAFAAGAVGAFFTPGAWYAALIKPAWNPPDSVFAPVWSVLYLTIAVSAWLVWLRAGWYAPGMRLWFLQLALNAAWSWLFFGRHEIALSLFDIALLWTAILATGFRFSRHSKLAAGLLGPYLAWVSFAAALNLAIWLLNR